MRERSLQWAPSALRPRWCLIVCADDAAINQWLQSAQHRSVSDGLHLMSTCSMCSACPGSLHCAECRAEKLCVETQIDTSRPSLLQLCNLEDVLNCEMCQTFHNCITPNVSHAPSICDGSASLFCCSCVTWGMCWSWQGSRWRC